MITTTNMPAKYRIPLFFALIAAGLAGNYFKYPIFLIIDSLFGSIFAMLALQFLGLGRGIVGVHKGAERVFVHHDKAR